jgi:demethylmenaquinone methyltransferase/2-methoxy-6-polyprenyl-1,4-benzoquinol methylase
VTGVAKHSARGAQPVGVSNEAAAAQAIRSMFDEIAPRYDLLNHVLSMNVDRLWWRRTARQFRHILSRSDARVVDLCCGTGDMTMALRKLAPVGAAPYVGIDFAHQMLMRGHEKFAGRGAIAVEGDALRLPLADNSVDLLTAAFGFRNLANYRAGLDEIRRVLRSGGEYGILDFSEPAGLLGKLYRFYFKNVLPKIGTVISGVRGPYAYLPASVERFPEPQDMVAQMHEAGFTDVSWTPYTFSIAGLYRGKKA